MQNPADPDTSYNARRGQGYLVQVMESYAEDEGDEKDSSRPDIITHVSVGKMTVHDSSSLVPAIEDAYSRGLAPEAAVKYAVCLRALGLNIFRCAAALRAA